MTLLDMLAKMCVFAQDALADAPKKDRDYVYQTISYIVSCFLAQHTKLDVGGVEWDVLYNDLCECDMSEPAWRKTIQLIADGDYGGFEDA